MPSCLRVAVVVLLGIAVIDGTGQTAARAQARTPLDSLYAAYIADPANALTTRLRTRDDFEAIRPDLIAGLARWKRAWDPRRATFTLEVGIAAFEQNRPNASGYLSGAVQLVLARPTPPGANPQEDAFELTFHKAVVAFLAGLPMPVQTEQYLDLIRSRVASGATTGTRPKLSDPRLILSRAMALEFGTLPAVLPRVSSNTLRSWTVGSNNAARVRLKEVLGVLDLAARYPETVDEALVRRAFLLHRLGMDTEALAIAGGMAPPRDPVVEYWRELVRGRILNSLGQIPQAIAAYEHAASLQPRAQTPAIALTGLMLRTGDRDVASAWAERARTTPDSPVDPWALYWAGDRRFLPMWLAELRRARLPA